MRGRRACLGDIAQVFTKMRAFLLIFRGETGASFAIEQISIFLINFTNCQFNCITFVKQQ